MRPSVSPRMRAAPEATSRICSTLWTRVPSRSAWYSHVFRRYRLRMWQMVESAVSSTAADGMLHTAMPGEDRARPRVRTLGEGGAPGRTMCLAEGWGGGAGPPAAGRSGSNAQRPPAPTPVPAAAAPDPHSAHILPALCSYTRCFWEASGGQLQGASSPEAGNLPVSAVEQQELSRRAPRESRPDSFPWDEMLILVLKKHLSLNMGPRPGQDRADA